MVQAGLHKRMLACVALIRTGGQLPPEPWLFSSSCSASCCLHWQLVSLMRLLYLLFKLGILAIDPSVPAGPAFLPTLD